ncbi:MAG: glutathione S-transferase family protein [Hyphomicrobium sp.]
MESQRLSLIIGDKNWSSWSLRPWLVLKYFSIPFEEISLKLRQKDTKQSILAHSASGKVPILKVENIVIWDSLSIIEYLADAYPQHSIWPDLLQARALARSLSAEMHSGFQALREHCPMDILSIKLFYDLPETVEHNLRRIIQIFCDFRKMHETKGPFLFGTFCAADAMYAPVCSRLRTYIPDLSKYGDNGRAAEYVNMIFKMPEIEEWIEGAVKEKEL